MSNKYLHISNKRSIESLKKLDENDTKLIRAERGETLTYNDKDIFIKYYLCYGSKNLRGLSSSSAVIGIAGFLYSKQTASLKKR